MSLKFEMFDIAIIRLTTDNLITNELLERFPFAKVFDKQDSQLNLIKEIVSWARTEHVWILSNINDYKDFDLAFVPIPDQKYQIHAWPNDDHNYHTFLVPVNYFKEQFAIQDLKQYKHVNWHTTFVHKSLNVKDNLQPLDIFYISNGEPFAEENYKFASSNVNRSIHWVKDINNRTHAFQYAAKLSQTEWFFVIPAKLQPAKDFIWDWLPMSGYYNYPKHFIFTATNPLNELEYGHMALVAYNKNLVLDTHNPGLDFTLSKPYESIPINSGIANFNLDPLTTWRTAFREVVKLKYFAIKLGQPDAELRLNIWLNRADGLNSNWCLQGAQDAAEYYDSCNGDITELEKTYHWHWLNQFQKTKGYNL